MADHSSDGVDEFASNFDNDATTTPFRSVKLADSAARSSAQAGPSSRPMNGAPKRKRSPELIEIDTDENDVVQPSSTAKGKRPLRLRKASQEPEPTVPARNAKKPPSQRKGKGKAGNAAERYPSPASADPDVLDAIQEEEVQIVPPQSAKRNVPSKQANDKHASVLQSKEYVAIVKKVEELTLQRTRLAQELEEMTHLKNTDMQENMDYLKQVYESRIRTQEVLIKELTSQVARVQPELSGDKEDQPLYFLTREAADAELRGLEQELERAQKILSDRDRIINEQEERIRILESDLKAEVENYKRLATRQSNSSGSLKMINKSHATMDTKQTQVIKLYEDISNLLVTDVKIEETSDSDVLIFRCVYTHRDSQNSISFTLRVNEDHENPGEENMRVLYTADTDTLAEMTPEMRQKLDFLADTFTFPRKQMDAFYDNLNTALGKSSDSDEEE